MSQIEIDAPQGKWWSMAYGAGYPDWLIKTPLPPAHDGERWIWTGRALVSLPAELYEFWFDAHRNPVRVEDLRDALAPYVEKGEHLGELLRIMWSTGLFIGWPWGHVDASDTPEAIALQSNLVAVPENPLPAVIPDAEWPGLIPMDRMVTLWRDARERTALPGLYDVVQEILQSGAAWLVARPLLRVRS